MMVKNRLKSKKIIHIIILNWLIFSIIPHFLYADDVSWNTVTVLGARDQESSLPGSGERVAVSDIRRHSYDDIHRILSKVPGVYVREEDGFGLFPNISLRGVDVGRSQKVTLLEDGIPMAPAPYAAPAAYYSPMAGRMAGIEILKGSSQVKYGPHSTGGVVNYLSTPIPRDREFYLKALTGNNREVRFHSYAGETFQTDLGKIGYLVEQSYRENEGFKKIDATPDFRKGGDTGFQRSEPMIKLAWESPDHAERFQKLEWMAGYTDIEAHETYLGLTEENFATDPFRRYAASRFDHFDARQSRTSLRYLLGLSDNLQSVTTGYSNRFKRNWAKLQNLNGKDLARVLAGGGEDLEVMKGRAAGSWKIRNNNREYAQWGVMQNLILDGVIGETNHSLDVGIGYHSDYERRNQHEETYTQDVGGTARLTAVGAPGSQSRALQEADAVHLYVRDTMTFGSWSLTPGLRKEWIDYAYEDRRSGVSGSSDLSVMTGGLGAHYFIDASWSFFGGVHQGVSVPGPQSHARDGVKEEKSLTLETGLRYQDQRQAFRAEVVLFHTDFRDLVVADNIGGGGSAVTDNAGDASARGFELKSSFDPGLHGNWGFSNPWYGALTYTHARLESDASSTDAESIFSGGLKGNRMPYIPEIQFAVGTGVESQHWGLFLDGIYTDETYTTASNTKAQIDAAGVPDARFGTADSRFILDLSAHYQPGKRVKYFINLHNLADKEYIVSRHPYGPRPGVPFTMHGGVEIKF